MKRQVMQRRDFGFLMIQFCISTVAIVGGKNQSHQNLWISILASVAPGILIMLLYTRLHVLMPRKNFFDISELVYGPVFGRVINLIFFAFCVLLAILSIYNYGNFVRLNALFSTPSTMIGLAFIVPAMLLAKKGGHVLGTWGFFTGIFVLFIMLILFAFSGSQFDLRNLQPVGNLSAATIGEDAFHTIVFPVCEGVVLLGLMDYLDDKEKPLRTFLVPMLIVYLLLLLLSITSVGVLGAPMVQLMLYPNYKAIAAIQIGFLERIEIFLGATYILTAITKIACCMLAASKGAAKLLRTGDESHYVVPLAFLTLGLSIFSFRDIVEMIDHFEYYYIYAPVIQIALPLILWIGTEIWNIKKKRLSVNAQSQIPSSASDPA